jgi:hypothetical protein
VSEQVQIRTPRVTLFPVFALAVCTLPLASAAPWLAVLWLLPIAVGAWVLRAGVDVDTGGLTVLSAGRRGQLSAVLRSGGSVRLPVVRARHLPLLAAASGGRVPDPTAAPAAEE